MRKSPRTRAVFLAGLALFASASAPATAAEVVKYYHSDAVGNVRTVTDRNGAVLERFEYYPFGEDVTTPSTPTHRRFTGKERDDESGLDYFGARHYLARTARFTSVDPAMTVEQNLANPQRWNRYAYAANNPVRYVDPDGRDWVAQIFLGERGKDVSTWQALTGADAQAHYHQTAVEHPFITGQLTVASTLFTGPLGDAVGGVMSFRQLTKGQGAPAEPAPAEVPAYIYRGGGSNPGNLRTRPGEDAVSFRDSLSNPFPLKEGQRPPLGSGTYIKVDTSRLPAGSVKVDNVPPGHVSVGGASPEQIKAAVVEKGVLP